MTTKTKQEAIVIAAPNFETAEIHIIGNAPYVQNAFSRRTIDKILAGQTEGKRAKSRKNLEPRDVDRDYNDAMHKTPDGKYGIPAPAFRSAMISACRVAGFVMTKAKLSVFIEADDFDVECGTPLVYLNGEPKMHISSVKLASGVTSIAIRPMWRKWSAKVRVKYDADMFGANDIVNLLHRAGQQVGIGEGRPDSRNSHGMGWGTFDIEGMKVSKAA